MTGRGCDDIYRILEDKGLTFGDMFGRCESRYGLGNFHFTRLDVAIDDKNEKSFFTIEQIKKKCEKEEFISTPQRRSISVLENRAYPTAFMTRIRKSVQNIIRPLMKSGAGNGQKCNCVMTRLMPLP